ncbi:unnamed protein product [Urochloa humidicola]
MLGNGNTSRALSAFDKMEEKVGRYVWRLDFEMTLGMRTPIVVGSLHRFRLQVMAMESQTEARGQLATDDLEGKFALLETFSVDDDLAQMKRELSGSSSEESFLRVEQQ